MRIDITSEDIVTAFECVRDDPVFSESRERHEAGEPLPEMIRAFALRPELLRAFGQMSAGLYPGGLLERAVKEYVILTASVRNACQFCTGSHVDFVKMLGISEAPLEAVRDPSSLGERERLAIEYTRAVMSDSNKVSDSMFQSLRRAFSEPEIVELTLLIGFINMLNWFNNTLQVRYHGEYAAGRTDRRES